MDLSLRLRIAFCEAGIEVAWPQRHSDGARAYIRKLIAEIRRLRLIPKV